LRRVGALRAHRGEALPIARERHILGIETGNELAGKIGGPFTLGQAEEGPRAFAEALDEPRLGEKPQMARNPRLGLAQNGGEIGDRQFGLAEKRQNAQPCPLGGGFERTIERLERQMGRLGHERGRRSISLDGGQHIKICLYP